MGEATPVPVNRLAADTRLNQLPECEDAVPAPVLGRRGDRVPVRGVALLVDRCLQAAGLAGRLSAFRGIALVARGRAWARR